MSGETIKHGDLLFAVDTLSPQKVEKFAIALGVPKNIIETSQVNYPHDISRVKSDALEWWIRNEETSWEAVANALEKVDERNLAKDIQRRHGLPEKDGKSINTYLAIIISYRKFPAERCEGILMRCK